MKKDAMLLKEIKKAFKKDDLVSLVKTDKGEIFVIPGEAPSEQDIFEAYDSPTYSLLPEDELC